MTALNWRENALYTSNFRAVSSSFTQMKKIIKLRFCRIFAQQVTYECVSARCEGVLLRSCEGRSRFISCPFWQKINIISANYGRLTGGHICPGPVKTTYCGAARSLGKVRSYCQGKRSCIIRATNSRFGDPCRGTKKYLEVRMLFTEQKERF